jgi:hypothetical protein
MIGPLKNVQLGENIADSENLQYNGYRSINWLYFISEIFAGKGECIISGNLR